MSEPMSEPPSARLVHHGGMAWLVEADLAAAREADPGHRSPTGFFNLRALDALFCQHPHGSMEVVAHQVQLRPGRVCRMNGHLGWRCREDEPSASGIDVLEAQLVCEEATIGIGISAEYDHVGAEDHALILPDPRRPGRGGHSPSISSQIDLSGRPRRRNRGRAAWGRFDSQVPRMSKRRLPYRHTLWSVRVAPAERIADCG